MSEAILDPQSSRIDLIQEYLESYFSALPVENKEAIQILKSSMEYSVMSGGKRFRPVLCLMVAEAFGVPPQKVLAFGCAVEIIHTYSLIHDDLPCMDNDDFRRGQPTNHKKFGEEVALLAGDALVTEAFQMLAESYCKDPQIACRLITLLAKASGIEGMAGGQAMDLLAKKASLCKEDLDLVHRLKTGALIRVCCEGSGVVCGLPMEKVALLRQFGELLGFAFQLKDDLMDSKDQIEEGSFPALLGLGGTQDLLNQITQESLATLSKIGIEDGSLFDLVLYNQNRSL